MQTAIGYVRVSSEEQANEGISVAAQEAALRAYCDMRRMKLGDVVIDADVSGGRPLGKRAGGKKVLATAKTGGTNVVVSFKLDRLFRDAQDCLSVTRQWEEKGISLHLVDMGGQAVDTSSAMGQFFLLVLAGVAEMERNLGSERTKAALRYKRERGEKTGGQCPYGYELAKDGVSLRKSAAEQQIIRRIKKLRGGGFSYRAIAERLNEKAVPARGSRWHSTTVVRLLSASA